MERKSTVKVKAVTPPTRPMRTPRRSVAFSPTIQEPRVTPGRAVRGNSKTLTMGEKQEDVVTPKARQKRHASETKDLSASPGTLTVEISEPVTPRKSSRFTKKTVKESSTTPTKSPNVSFIKSLRSAREKASSEATLKSPIKSPLKSSEKAGAKTPSKAVLNTPKKTPLKSSEKAGAKTPSKSHLNTKILSPFKSPGKFTKGEWRFNSLGVPKCPLPCRESQFEEIWTFLNENISHKNSRCMYVSGVPGTGKTVIVQSVVNTLARYANERKQHLLFEYVYINGLSLGAPDKIWKRFYCGLKGENSKLTPQVALKKLDLYFNTSGRRPIVLVIDELDQILDKKQAILYQLLEWSAHHSTMFSLIAIFNTMSLPESGLAMRNVSRIGLIRCIFPPYTHDQLQTIVKNSLTASKNERIKDDAIVLLSKKVAAVSGDARRALEIAKRAVEIVEIGKFVGIKAVDAAFKEIFSSPKVDTMKHCTALEQLFLKTISAELQSTGVEETTLASIYNNLCTAAAFEGMNWSMDQVMNAAMRLCLMKLVIAENESTSIHKRLSLNVPVEDINFALDMKKTAHN